MNSDVLYNIRKILEIELTEISKAIKRELKAQGHNNTGRLLDSIDFRIDIESNGVMYGIIEGNDYIRYVNNGVPAYKIPFTRGSGRKSSKYIDGLVSYFRSKGLGPEEAKRAAFATATKHKREGMPTRASKRFSSTGKRKYAVDIAIEKSSGNLEEQLESMIDRTIRARIEIPISNLDK